MPMLGTGQGDRSQELRKLGEKYNDYGIYMLFLIDLILKRKLAYLFQKTLIFYNCSHKYQLGNACAAV